MTDCLAVERVLAQGGHSLVHLVRDAAGRPFALKQLAPGAPEDVAERLRAEGELLARARGPGVIALHATSGDALLLQFAPGGSLAECLEAGPLPHAEARRVFRRVAEAVARLHSRGIVHRDVKPSNILFAHDGTPLLADFGVAAYMGARGTLGDEWEELRVGTSPYAAPEQWSAPQSSSHPAADVHALAVLYREMIGELPREAARALDPDPARRPSTVAELLRALPSGRSLRALPRFLRRGLFASWA